MVELILTELNANSVSDESMGKYVSSMHDIAIENPTACPLIFAWSL